MKKVGVIVAAGLLSVSLLGPSQAAGPHRTQQFTYRAPSGFFVPGVATASLSLNNNWASFEVLSGERTVTFSIEDASGRPVLGQVFGKRFEESFCRSTDQAIKVRPGDTIYVGAMIGPCGANQVSVVTTGVITATFSR